MTHIKKNYDKNIKEISYEFENTNCLDILNLIETFKRIIENIYQNTLNENNQAMWWKLGKQ